MPLDLDVPAGIHDGQRIRVRGAGHAGTLGGPPGDVYVTVRVRPLEGVERDGDDLHVRASVTMTEAALGTTVSVPTPEAPSRSSCRPGRSPPPSRWCTAVECPPSRPEGGGYPRARRRARPQQAHGEQRAELARLETELGTDAYRDDDDGFLGRLKSAFR